MLRSLSSADAPGKAGGARNGEPRDVTPQERESDGREADSVRVEDPEPAHRQ